MSRMKPAFALALFLAAVSVGGAAAQTAGVKVVASFSIIADLVKQVGGARVDVTTLLGADSDMHGFQPTPADVKTVAASHLFVINGLGLEGWADRLVKSSGYKGHALVASRGIKSLPAGDDDGHGHDHEHDHGRYDPHAWQEVANVKRYAQNICDALIAVDPAGRAHYEAEAGRFLNELDALDVDIRSALAAIPKSRRKVITSHDAFSYFGDAYDITFLSPQGVGNDTEPSAKRVADLIRQIKREGVKSIFLENISSPRVLERIARETGVKIGGTLYSDSLSTPQGPASTYVAMMRYNTRLIADALR
jgi:zinc/manganese transport system substrate-binding protein